MVTLVTGLGSRLALQAEMLGKKYNKHQLGLLSTPLLFLDWSSG